MLGSQAQPTDIYSSPSTALRLLSLYLRLHPDLERQPSQNQIVSYTCGDSPGPLSPFIFRFVLPSPPTLPCLIRRANSRHDHWPIAVCCTTESGLIAAPTSSPTVSESPLEALILPAPSPPPHSIHIYPPPPPPSDMSDPSETSGRPSTTAIHQLDPNTPTLLPPQRRRRTSHSSDERIGGTKSISSRRRPGNRTETTFDPTPSSSHRDHSIMQRSASPTQMSPDSSSVHYTRTGRISKAKKGLKVHHCDCGRVSAVVDCAFRSGLVITRYAATPRSRVALSYTTPLPHRRDPLESSPYLFAGMI